MKKSGTGALFFLLVFLLSLGGCAGAPPDREAEAIAAANAALGSMNGGSLAGPPAAAFPVAASAGPAAVGGGAKPAWVDSPGTVYNRNSFVAAVGSGNSREQAEKSAFAALSSVYRLSLEADQTITNSYQEMVRNGQTSDWYEGVSLEESIRTSTAMDLVGATIRDVWSDGRSFYAVAVMENAQTARLYAQMIRDNQRIIDTLTDIPPANRNTMDGLARFQFATTLAEANKVFANVLSVIGVPAPAELRPSEDYRLECNAIIRAIPVSVTVEGDRENRIGSAFASALTAAGFRTGGNGAPYQLKGRITFTEVQLPNQTNKFIRYVLDGNFVDNATGETLFPYNVNGREGHVSISEAEARAIRAAETKIKDNYTATLSSFLAQLIPKK
ncbi:MAG: LPP20 family lipoprotein [Treponema sp.]|jgi:hypothetical protein|nr:LPP20 family lipoprotein [Treponema sp.]